PRPTRAATATVPDILRVRASRLAPCQRTPRRWRCPATFLARPDRDEGGVAEAGTRRLHLDHPGKRLGQGLAPGALAEAGFGEQAVDLVGREEHCIAVEDALVPVSLVMPAQGAGPIDEAEDDGAGWPRDPARLGEHRPRIVDEADRGHDQRMVEHLVAKRQGFGDAADGLDAALAGTRQHLERRI